MELIVTSTLPVFTGNFEVVKAQLLEGIKQYEIEVTEENISEAKKMATELNKLSTVINKVKSDKVHEVSAPIDVFKAQVGDLIDICQQGREKILSQVKVFEDQVRVKCKALLDIELENQLNERGIRPEFRTAVIDDLAVLSALTKSGALTKSAKEGVAQKVSELRGMQDKVDMRLLQLENAGLKAGLKSPLRREHVEAFLKAPDDQYDAQLSRLISIEISRQTETETRIKAEQEKPIVAPQMPAVPPVAPPPLPCPPLPTAAIVWNQDRLHQMRQGVGDEVFFQMFKIVYQPISDQAIREAIANNAGFNLGAAIEWAKGRD